MIKFIRWWAKLDDPRWSTLRFDEGTGYWDHRVGKEMAVVVAGEDRGRAVLDRVVRIRLSELTEEYAQRDGDMSLASLKALMHKWYHRRSQWRDDDTVMIELHFHWVRR